MKTYLALTALTLFAVPLWASQPGDIIARLPVPPEDFKFKKAMLGKLMPAKHTPIPGWDTSPLPRWEVGLGDRSYPLVFSSNKDLEAFAAQHSGTWVKIRGCVEQRRFVLGWAAEPIDRAVFDDARVVTLTVLVVEHLELAGLEKALQRSRG